MEDLYLYISMLVLLAAQIGCLFVKKIWVRLLPTLINVGLMVFGIVMYALGGWTNWGYLILLLLLFVLLAAMGLVWLIYGVIRLTQKQFTSCQ